MSISKINSNIAMGFVNNVSGLSQSITAVTNDVIFVALSMGKATGVNYAPTMTWNSQTFNMLANTESRDSVLRFFWLKVTTGGTATLTANLAAYARSNITWYLLRSDTDKFANPPIKTWTSYESDTEAYTKPSSNVTGVVSGDYVLDILHLIGWTSSYTIVSNTTATPDAPLTLEHSIQNTGDTSRAGRLYSAVTTGQTGSVTGAWTLSAATSNMYNHGLFVFAESVNNVSGPTNPLVPGGAMTATLEGYTAITSVSAIGLTATGISVNGTTLSATFGMIAEGQTVTSKLPVTNVPVSYTDGTSTSVLQQNIALPANYDTVRDEYGNVATMRDIITSHDEFVGKLYLDLGDPLAVGETFYWPTVSTVNGTPTANGFKISQIGEYEVNKSILPVTIPILRHKNNGMISQHNLTISQSGLITINLNTWTQQSASPVFDGMYPNSARP